MATARASYLQHKDYQAVSISHFLVDVLNSSRSLLVAILAVSIGLSNTQVAIALLLYNVGNALTQPFFGRLADRSGPRWLVIGGLSWMIIFFTVAAVAPPWPALAALTVAGLVEGARMLISGCVSAASSASPMSFSPASLMKLNSPMDVPPFEMPTMGAL